MLHSMGIDLAPYTRLAETFRDLISGSPIPPDPRPATFADGVANMVVLDAIRRSAAAGGERVLLDPGEARDEQ
jgi:predicted dehydrogenase